MTSIFDRLANALSGRQEGYRAPGEGKRSYTDANTPGHECNERTDFPAAQPTPRRCVGQCTPSRQPMTHAGQTLNAVNAVAGLIDWQQLVQPRNEDEAAEWSIQRRMAETDRMPSPAVYYGKVAPGLLQQGEAIDAERQRLLDGCTELEQCAARTYQEARLVGMSDRDALAGMGLGRGEGNRVERLQPVKRGQLR
jgi:hypothetical protein